MHLDLCRNGSPVPQRHHREAHRPVVLGVDPGTALLGYGLVEGSASPKAVDYGVLATRPDRTMAQRLLQLYEGLDAIVRRYRPDALAVEQLFFARNVTTALSVGQARGIVLLVSAQHDIPVVEYKPAEVKQAVAGYGGATKAQVQDMIRLLLDLPTVPQPDDAADALAVALCHLLVSRFDQRVSATRIT